MQKKSVVLFTFLCVIASPAWSQQLEMFMNGQSVHYPLAAPGSGSDCGVLVQNNVELIRCALIDVPVTAAQSPYQIPASAWGHMIVCSGGGTATVSLPNSPPRGAGSFISFATDGKTGCSIHGSVPMQGSTRVVNNIIPISPGEVAFAQFSTNGTPHWNVNGVMGPEPTSAAETSAPLSGQSVPTMQFLPPSSLPPPSPAPPR